MGAGHPVGDGREVGLAPADQARQPADGLGPAQPIQGVLDAEHRRRVDGVALKMASMNSPPLVKRKILGRGHAGL